MTSTGMRNLRGVCEAAAEAVDPPAINPSVSAVQRLLDYAGNLEWTPTGRTEQAHELLTLRPYLLVEQESGARRRWVRCG